MINLPINLSYIVTARTAAILRRIHREEPNLVQLSFTPLNHYRSMAVRIQSDNLTPLCVRLLQTIMEHKLNIC